MFCGDQGETAEWVLGKLSELDPGVLWMVSPDWTELFFVSDSYEDIWGRSIEDLQAEPRDFLNGVHPEDRDQVETAMERVSDELSVDIECRIRPATADAPDQRYVRIVAEPVYDEGKLVAIAGFVHDITAQRRDARQLRYRNEQLEQLNRFLSHDLTNHLQVAMGSLDQARRTGDAAAYDMAERSLERIDELTSDISTLVQPETVDPTTVPLSEVAEDCWEATGPTAATLTVTTDLTLMADEGLLRRLLNNLLRNAVVHNEPPVAVRIGELTDGTNGFYIADDGAGIQPEVQDEVFEAGYTTSEEGSGLGLAIVRLVATAHEWEVTVTDSETGGARFEFASVDTVDS